MANQLSADTERDITSVVPFVLHQFRNAYYFTAFNQPHVIHGQKLSVLCNLNPILEYFCKSVTIGAVERG